VVIRDLGLRELEMFIFKSQTQYNKYGTSNGFWYDITNGYIKPEDLLVTPEQIEEVKDAVALLEELEQALEDKDLLNEF